MKWGGADQHPHRVRCLPRPVTPGIAAQYAAETGRTEIKNQIKSNQSTHIQISTKTTNAEQE